MKLEALFEPNLAYLTPTTCFLEVTTIETNEEIVAWSLAGFAVAVATALGFHIRQRRHQVTTHPQNGEGIEFQVMQDHPQNTITV